MNINTFREYCTGCGLCSSTQNVSFTKDEKGYNLPNLRQEDLDFCSAVCPAGGAASALQDRTHIWGKTHAVYIGWARDSFIRKKASSGGILTALCCFLLNKGIVDGIIQTRADDQIVYGTQTVISRNREEVFACMGSRYSISSPLSQIKDLVLDGECYAFVGKPCDVSALRMYLEQDAVLKKQIKYIFSFFCAGMPSNTAQHKLLAALGCSQPEECSSLQYRGNGWPGYASVTKKDGTISQMSYESSWGHILGRDVRKSCRFCLDGVGEFADISCGDVWHLTPEKKPDFSEGEGRNVIFARTGIGNSLIKEACSSGYIHVTDYSETLDDLRYIQKYQYERKIMMGSMLHAMTICNKPIPSYNKKTLKSFSARASHKARFKRMLGTMKRVIQEKI